MQLNLSSGSYVDNCVDVNNQLCVNWFPVAGGPQGRGDQTVSQLAHVMIPTAGTQLLVQLPGTLVRYLGAIRDYVYAVVDNTIYKLTVDSSARTATYVSIGTISSTSTAISVAANPTQIIFVDTTTSGYIYNDTTNTFTTISDGDFPGGSSVVFIDGYFVVSKPGSGGLFYFSDLNNGLSWDALAVATAESNTDDIISLQVVKGELWVIGTASVEIWYNAGNSSGAPFSARVGLELAIGCTVSGSIVLVNDLLILLDNRGYIVQSDISPLVRNNNSGYNLNIISTDALTREILSYEVTSDAQAITYIDRGHLMYQISFPSEKKTHVYDYITQQWHTRSYYDTYTGEAGHHLAQYHAKYNNIDIVAGVRDSKIYIMDSIYDDDAGVHIRRIKHSSYLYDKDNNKKISIYGLFLRVGQIRVPVTGDYTEPQIGMRYSNDGGHTWSARLFRSLGSVGQNALEISWHMLGTYREWLFEFSVSDPVSFVIIEARLNASLEA